MFLVFARVQKKKIVNWIFGFLKEPKFSGKIKYLKVQRLGVEGVQNNFHISIVFFSLPQF